MADETKSDLTSTTEDASNTALDVVTDLALDTAIPAPIRRNALKAFDRLCSALIDVPVGALERKSAEKRAESEARIKIRNEITTQIIEQTKVDPAYALRAGHKFAEKIIQEQLNLDKIFAIAANELKADEPDTLINQEANESNKEQSDDSTNRSENSGEEKTIGDVWINIFETEARPQSTKEGRLLFGRILAGEIKQPGSYSMRTLKSLGELDEKAAALFKVLCSACVVMEFPLTKPRHIAGVKGLDLYRDPEKNIFDMRVPALGGDPGQGDLSKYGFGFSELNVLNEYGLITSNYNSSFEYNLFLNKENSLPIISFRHQGKDWILFSLPGRDKSQGFKWAGVELSQVGRELYSVVDQHPMDEYTEDLKKFLTEQDLTMVEA